MLKHARRTVGFFKVRGVNINHADLEDALFRDPDVVDFRAEVVERWRQRRAASFRRDAAPGRSRAWSKSVRKTLQVTPQVSLLPRGTIAKDFEAAVKAPRFVDKRG